MLSVRFWKEHPRNTYEIRKDYERAVKIIVVRGEFIV